MRTRGFSLLELMIALALGLALTMAFITVLQRCRQEMAVSESLAQLETSARQAMDVLIFDLEHAGFFGLPGNPARQLWRAGTLIAEGDALRQPDASHPRSPVPGLPAGSHDCGVNFAVDLELAVQGTSNFCDTGANALTIRHASLELVKPRAGRLQIYLRRLEANRAAVLFADGRAPGRLDDAEIRNVEVRSYYVARNSVGRPGWPALRVKALTESRGVAQFRDEEVMPGVEDLQVEFGLRDGTGAHATLRFVTPDFPKLRAQKIVAVRVWLRMRADSTEHGEAGQRRLLIERTVALRNPPAP
jgi:type IV pilus assembly protein PilW